MERVGRLLNLVAGAMSLVAVAIFTLVLVVGTANALPWLLPVGFVTLLVALVVSLASLMAWLRR